MSDDLRTSRNAPAGPTTVAPPLAPAATTRANRVPRTRTGATWFGICVAALLMVVLIIFMLQNTGSVQVNFLGMHGSLPLALALLVAAVGAGILTMTIGAARITQLRRLTRRRQRAATNRAEPGDDLG